MILKSTARVRRQVAVGSLLVVAALVAGACNSGTPSAAPASAGASAGAAATSAPAAGNGAKIIMIGGKTDDPFFSKVKKGIDDSAKVVEAYGGTVTYLGPVTYDNLGPDIAKLLQTALAQKPDAVGVPDWVPDAEDPAITALIQAGIPVMIYNTGTIDAALKLGALNYVGNDEYTAGVAGGEYLGKGGAKNILCVNTVPGAANIEARCKGLEDGITKTGGKAINLPLPASSFGNPTAVAQAIKAELLKDPTIDAAVAIGAADATAVASGIDQAGSTGKVKLGSFDFDSAGLDRIKAGTQAMAIDQQPYLQGSLTVSLLNAYVLFGNNISSQPVATGPNIIDSSTVELVLKGVAAGAR